MAVWLCGCVARHLKKIESTKELILSFVSNSVKRLQKFMQRVYGEDCLSRGRVHVTEHWKKA